jgi:hypothetical protein
MSRLVALRVREQVQQKEFVRKRLPVPRKLLQQLGLQERPLHKREVAKDYRRAAQAPSPSVALPEDKRALLEQFDKFAPFRNKLAKLAQAAGEWAGIPTPLDDHELVVDPGYAFSGLLEERTRQKRQEKYGDGPQPKVKVRNIFFSWKYRCDVAIIELDGKVTWRILGAVNQADLLLKTADCSYAWGIEQEHAALERLAQLIPHHLFKMYLLTGTFFETSKRSGLVYMFRKLRPTVVFHEVRETEIAVLCTLCLHPIGYYADSWAGAMCPTDDVIAHLMLMRGDEHRFWKMSNQHPSWRRQSGL